MLKKDGAVFNANAGVGRAPADVGIVLADATGWLEFATDVAIAPPNANGWLELTTEAAKLKEEFPVGFPKLLDAVLLKLNEGAGIAVEEAGIALEGAAKDDGDPRLGIVVGNDCT